MYVPGKGPGLHLSGARGPRLKSLDLPLRVCIYIRTYILTVARTCSCAEPVWSLSDPVLSCFFYASRLKALFAASTTSTVQYSTVQYTLPCTATHHTYLLHCTILHCAVPWPACIRRVCCRVPSHYHRPGLSFSVANTPTARKRYRVHRARSSSALCHGYLINHRVLTQPGGVRASNPYLLVRDMNEDHPHTTR